MLIRPPLSYTACTHHACATPSGSFTAAAAPAVPAAAPHSPTAQTYSQQQQAALPEAAQHHPPACQAQPPWGLLQQLLVLASQLAGTAPCQGQPRSTCLEVTAALRPCLQACLLLRQLPLLLLRLRKKGHPLRPLVCPLQAVLHRSAGRVCTVKQSVTHAGQERALQHSASTLCTAKAIAWATHSQRVVRTWSSTQTYTAAPLLPCGVPCCCMPTHHENRQ